MNPYSMNTPSHPVDPGKDHRSKPPASGAPPASSLPQWGGESNSQAYPASQSYGNTSAPTPGLHNDPYGYPQYPPSSGSQSTDRYPTAYPPPPPGPPDTTEYPAAYPAPAQPHLAYGQPPNTGSHAYPHPAPTAYSHPPTSDMPYGPPSQPPYNPPAYGHPQATGMPYGAPPQQQQQQQQPYGDASEKSSHPYLTSQYPYPPSAPVSTSDPSGAPAGYATQDAPVYPGDEHAGASNEKGIGTKLLAAGAVGFVGYQAYQMATKKTKKKKKNKNKKKKHSRGKDDSDSSDSSSGSGSGSDSDSS